MSLGRITPTRKAGSEMFHSGGNDLEFSLLEFWQWSVSDLVSNATRGRLAEFIVARALGISTARVRDEWQPYDLVTADGCRIEVKSAAYLQSWFQKEPCKIRFSIRGSRFWDAENNTLSPEIKRQADIYVFALLDHKDKATLDPLNLDQWKFYVVPTARLDERAPLLSSLSLQALGSLGAVPLSFEQLRGALDSSLRAPAGDGEGGDAG